jgi:hypothetical protein
LENVFTHTLSLGPALCSTPSPPSSNLLHPIPCFYRNCLLIAPQSDPNISLPPPPCLSTEFATNCTLSGCQDNCSVTPLGAACYCKSGYEIGLDGKTCKGEF